MRILILGGTGFIGYHTCLELISQGHRVETLSLADIELESWFPPEAKVFYRNIFEMPFKEMVNLFSGYDGIIYSIGPDDRVTPPAPAYDFFYQRLVKACRKIADAAREGGIKKAVITNSYFCYFDRTRPELKLAERHPYIDCRVKQADRVIEAGQNSMDVMVMELPYIFGAMPNRTPLWKDVLLRRLKNSKTIYFPRGGSPMISVEQVAKALCGALSQGIHGTRYPIGDENWTWDQMLSLMLHEMGMSHKKILHPPKIILNRVGESLYRKEKRKGRESGLDLRYIFKDILSHEFFYDNDHAKKALGFPGGDLEESIRKAVRACMPL